MQGPPFLVSSNLLQLEWKSIGFCRHLPTQNSSCCFITPLRQWRIRSHCFCFSLALKERRGPTSWVKAWKHSLDSKKMMCSNNKFTQDHMRPEKSVISHQFWFEPTLLLLNHVAPSRGVTTETPLSLKQFNITGHLTTVAEMLVRLDPHLSF